MSRQVRRPVGDEPLGAHRGRAAAPVQLLDLVADRRQDLAASKRAKSWANPDSAPRGWLIVAAQVGLSPAATTEAVQRLIARGFVTRDTDPADRRRAVIATSGRGAELIEEVYQPMHAGGIAILDDYTEDELVIITGFLERGRRLQMEQADRVRRLAAL